ncbi:unnamed protein product [Thelazia callipaeda]|uniref:Reverse transcriptase n=1 Tax=Thelazia callipaeda TaxID=103827 RepID=A0A0N5CTY5_THECL|nr:unnamed protein product [Thelazia callipaeda]
MIYNLPSSLGNIVSKSRSSCSTCKFFLKGIQYESFSWQRCLNNDDYEDAVNQLRNLSRLACVKRFYTELDSYISRTRTASLSPTVFAFFMDYMSSNNGM